MTDDPYRQYDPRQYPPPSGYPAPEQPDQPAYPPTQPYPTGQPAGGGQYYGGGYYGGGQSPGGQYGGGQPAGGGHYGGGRYGGGYQDQYGAGGYQDQYGAGGQPSSWPAAEQSPPPRRRRTGLIVGLVAGGLALVLCLAGIAFVALRVVDRVEDPAGGGDPFADTPAASFAEGADGIQLPEPEAVGDFSAEQVADTLDRVKEALIATRLAPTMLVDRDPEPFLSMMSEDNRPLLRDDFESGNFKYFASQLADGAKLTVPDPRVEGEITFEATRDEGNLRVIEVVTSFVWAYAFEVPDDNPELDGVVVVRDRLVWQVAHEEDVRESSMGLWLWDGEAFAWGIDCTAFADGLLSPQTEPGPEGEGQGDPADVFDPSAGAPDLGGTC